MSNSTQKRAAAPGRNDSDASPQKYVRDTSTLCEFFGSLGMLERRTTSKLPRGIAMTNSSVLHPILEAITTVGDKNFHGRFRKCDIHTTVSPSTEASGRPTESGTIVYYNDHRFVCAAVSSNEEQLSAALDDALAVSILLTPSTGYSMIVIAVARTRVHMGLLSMLRMAPKQKNKSYFSASRGLKSFPSNLKKRLSDANVQTVPFIGPEADDVEYRSDRVLQYAITFDAATVTYGFEAAFEEYVSLLVKPICCGLRKAISKRQILPFTMTFSNVPAVLQLQKDSYKKKDSKKGKGKCEDKGMDTQGQDHVSSQSYVCRMFSTDNYKRVIRVYKKAGLSLYAFMVCRQSKETMREFPPLPGKDAADPFLMCCYHGTACKGGIYGLLPRPPAAAKLLAILAVLHDVYKVAHGNIRMENIVQNSATVAFVNLEHGTSLATGKVCLPTNTLSAAALKQFIPELRPERQQVLLSDEGLQARLMDILGFFLFVWLEHSDVHSLNIDDGGRLRRMYNSIASVVNSADVDGGTPTRDLLPRMLETMEELQKVKHVIEEHALFEKRSMKEVNAAFTVPEWR